MARSLLPPLALTLAALLGCKKEQRAPAPEPAAVPPEAPAAPAEASAAPAEAPAPEPRIENFAGSYLTNYGKARCTQVKRNVNCLYQGKSGSLDCKVENETELACEWEDPAGTGQARLRKQADGKLVGTWGWKTSEKNGGSWTFKPVAD